jgi:hypothetical protein
MTPAMTDIGFPAFMACSSVLPWALKKAGAPNWVSSLVVVAILVWCFLIMATSMPIIEVRNPIGRWLGYLLLGFVVIGNLMRFVSNWRAKDNAGQR